MKAIIDCNSFYCSCERLFRPDLLERPVIVLSNNDGCIVSRSDEAKQLGVQMAGAYYEAKPLIERHGVSVFSSNYHLYGDMSYRVMETLRQYMGANNVEVYSVDEAFVDMDAIPADKLYEAAMDMRQVVEQWTGIKVSIGVAPTKVLAKVANRLSKKDKQGTQCVVVLDNDEAIAKALQATPVDDVWGVGRRYAKKLHGWNIDTAYHLGTMSEEWAHNRLGGVTGVRLVRELRGQACIGMKEPLETKQMIATTRMFGKPVFHLKDLKEAVATYISRAAEKLRRQYCAAKFLDVFLVTNDYETGDYRYNPRSQHQYITLPAATSDTRLLIQHALPLVEELYKPGSRYLKAGVTLGSLVPDDAVQGNLFMPPARQAQRMLMSTVDNINFGMRADTVKYAASGFAREWKMKQALRSPRHTTRWEELYEIS